MNDWDQDDVDSESEGDESTGFVDWFLSTRGGEFFCDVDEEYITDRFNLTGLSAEVPHFHAAYEIVTDNVTANYNKETQKVYEASGRLLYGLIHARYIITPRGLQKMLDKYKQGDFGVCPRYFCKSQHLLPVGISDVVDTKPVQLYCPHCEDMYTPKSSRYAEIDGAFFGPTFPHMLLQLNSGLTPPKSDDRYVPKIFGFRVHETSNLHRRQDREREDTRQRLSQAGLA